MNSLIKNTFRPLWYRLSDTEFLQKWAHRSVLGSRFRSWCASNPCPEFPTREALYKSAFESEGLDGPIDYLEFGVWRGESIRWWLDANREPSSTFFGFDSFEGLPVNWEGMPKGSFSTGGEVPDISDPRCQFVKGYFQETLPAWLEGRSFTRKLVIHMDADLYGSTLLVLLQLMPRMRPGDVVLFDEFNSYMHEFRALQDALAAFPRDFQSVGRTGRWSQAALKAT